MEANHKNKRRVLVFAPNGVLYEKPLERVFRVTAEQAVDGRLLTPV